jgi:hypothetical protein
MTLFCFGLMGCSGIVTTKYITQTLPPIPEKPSYYEMKWHGTNGEYCLNEDSAKSLLKNMELMKDYIRQLEEYIKGLL